MFVSSTSRAAQISASGGKSRRSIDWLEATKSCTQGYPKQTSTRGRFSRTWREFGNDPATDPGYHGRILQCVPGRCPCFKSPELPFSFSLSNGLHRVDPAQLSKKAVRVFQQRPDDQHRPSYPADAVKALLSAVGVSGMHGTRIVDFAAETEKFTELLAARGDEFDILAVEPYAGMRKELERKQLNKVIVKEGLFTAIPTENATVDAVIAAQVRNYYLFSLPSFVHVQHICLVLAPMFLWWHSSQCSLFLSDTPTAHYGADHDFSL